jgi:branched-chain amino acid transport system substrate-binding protein
MIIVAGLVVGCKQAAPTPTPTPKPIAQPTQVPPTAPPPKAEPIKIGGIGPLSPPGMVSAGQEIQNALLLRIDEINAAGGLLGRPLQLVFEDSSGTPEKGTAAMEKLISKDKVIAVIGEAHSSAFLAEMEVAHRYNVLFMDVECWASDIRLRGYPEVFELAPSNVLFAKDIGEFLKGTGFKRAYILTEDTDYGVDIMNLMKEQFVQQGLEVATQVVDRTSKDFVPFLMEAQKFKPDILVETVTGVGVYLIVKQAKEIGLAPTANCGIYLGDAGAGSPELWTTAGAAAQYTLWSTPYHPQVKFTDLTKSFFDNYQSKFGRPPVSTGFQAYDAMLAVEEAIRSSGSTDTNKMGAALEKAAIKGTRGTMTFPTEKGVFYHQAPAPLVHVQFTELNMPADETEILWPLQVATAKYQKPPQ